MPQADMHYYFILVTKSCGERMTTRIKSSNETLALAKLIRTLRKDKINHIKSLSIQGKPVKVSDTKGKIPRIIGGSACKKPSITDYIAVYDGSKRLYYKHKLTEERISVDQFAELD